MPKIVLSETQRERDRLRKNLKLMQGQKTSIDMSKILGVSKSTYLNRLKYPEQLTLAETKRLCNYFKVPIEKFVICDLKIQ